MSASESVLDAMTAVVSQVTTGITITLSKSSRKVQTLRSMIQSFTNGCSTSSLPCVGVSCRYSVMALW